MLQYSSSSQPPPNLSTPPPPTPARPQVQFGMPTIVSNNSGGSGGSSGGGSGGGGSGGAEDGLYLSVPAFSGMMVNDELSLAIMNYKYNNQLLTDNNIAGTNNENFILPTGDPEFKPIKMFDWNKDYSVPNVGLHSLNIGVNNTPFNNTSSKNKTKVPTALPAANNNLHNQNVNLNCVKKKKLASELAMRVFAYYNNQKGPVKYIFGGNELAFDSNGNPTGNIRTDCSGFVQQVYKAAGIDLPRTAYTQYNKIGTSTPGYVPSDLQPGDLVFYHFSDPSDPYPVNHVAMYVGHGYVVEFANSRQYMRYRPVSDFVNHIVGVGSPC